jgi:hypothetical protein
VRLVRGGDSGESEVQEISVKGATSMCSEAKDAAVERLTNQLGEFDRQVTQKQWEAQRARAGIGGQIGGALMPEAATEAFGARAAIRELMEWHMGESERLSVLLKSLPGILPPAADRALSDLVFRAKGRK